MNHILDYLADMSGPIQALCGFIAGALTLGLLTAFRCLRDLSQRRQTIRQQGDQRAHIVRVMYHAVKAANEATNAREARDRASQHLN